MGELSSLRHEGIGQGVFWGKGTGRDHRPLARHLAMPRPAISAIGQTGCAQLDELIAGPHSPFPFHQLLSCSPIALLSIKTKVGGTLAFDYSTRNELTKITSGGNNTALYYDLRGNLTKKGNAEYYWSADDKMTKVAVNGNTAAEYKYDLFGRRVAKKVGDNGDWRWFFYDGLNVVAEGTQTNDKMFYTLAPGDIGAITTPNSK